MINATMFFTNDIGGVMGINCPKQPQFPVHFPRTKTSKAKNTLNNRSTIDDKGSVILLK